MGLAGPGLSSRRHELTSSIFTLSTQTFWLSARRTDSPTRPIPATPTRRRARRPHPNAAWTPRTSTASYIATTFIQPPRCRPSGPKVSEQPFRSPRPGRCWSSVSWAWAARHIVAESWRARRRDSDPVRMQEGRPRAAFFCSVRFEFGGPAAALGGAMAGLAHVFGAQNDHMPAMANAGRGLPLVLWMPRRG